MHHAQTPFQQEAVELKGSALTVVVLHLKSSDPRILYPQLEELIDDAGAFLASAPVVIDVASLPEQAQEMLDFSYLLRFLRGVGLMPVGLQGAANSQKDRINQAGLLLVATAQKGSSMPAPQPEKSQTSSQKDSKPEPRTTEQKRQTEQSYAAVQAGSTEAPYIEPELTGPSQTALVITQPVRAGQQISAPNGDLIVLASVNAGSELFAAGNIHVYGALRGRALAGVNGDTDARIFTLQGNPELLAIAGEYVVNEELPRRAVNQSFAASWSDSGLRFQILGSFVL